MNGYIIDELYINALEKWWTFAMSTPVYEELMANMYQMKSTIFEKTLVAMANTKSYKLGNQILKLPKKIKGFVGRS